MNDLYTVRDVIKSKLRKLGCDGLANPDAECGCGIDDLIPCQSDCSGCLPAKSKVTRNGMEWHAVGLTKKAKPASPATGSGK
jgi:hypothetical protein